MSDTPINTHVVAVNEDSNGGEKVTIKTDFFLNGSINDKDTEVFLNTEIALQSYCNSASIHLVGAALTPKFLRKLADDLDNIENEILMRIKVSSEMYQEKLMRK